MEEWCLPLVWANVITVHGFPALRGYSLSQEAGWRGWREAPIMERDQPNAPWALLLPNTPIRTLSLLSLV